MITALSIFIIIVSSFIVFFLIKLDEKVVDYHKKFIGDVIAATEKIKDARKSLHDVNRIVKIITNPKYINTYKMIMKLFDILDIAIFTSSLRNDKNRLKKLFSPKFLKHAYSLYKTLTA